MKSIKSKLSAAMLFMVIISSISMVSASLYQSFKVSSDITATQFEEKLNTSENMLEMYLEEQFGDLSLSNGTLLDSRTSPIDGRFEYIDKFSDNMNVVATVFSKKDNDFIRVLTTIKDENGQRAVGTLLDNSTKAYEALSKGNEFFGTAEILGKSYLTKYTPMTDSSGKIIGLYFVGVSDDTVKNIISEGKASTLRTVAMLSVLILIIAVFISMRFASRISKPLKKVTDVAHEIADGNFDVILDIDSNDEIGDLSASFNKTVSRLSEYQSYLNPSFLADGNITIS